MLEYFDRGKLDALSEYAVKHSTKTADYLHLLERETWQKAIQPRMLSGREQGRMLSLFSKMIQPGRIIELGTYTGYSALCLAEGLKPDGELITIDINDELQWLRNKYFQMSPYSHCIQSIHGEALNVLKTINLDADIVFIDADKSNYLNYYRMFRSQMRRGSWIIADNVLWSGKVIDLNAKDDDTMAIREFNDYVLNDNGVITFMWPIRDGMTIIQITE
jgi:caffeoyl-CoA O-methyltransferase